MKTSRIIPRPMLAACGCVLVAIHALAVLPPSRLQLPNIDKRPVTDAAQGKAKKAEAIQNLRRLVPPVRVDFDEFLATPKWVIAERGFLTGPDGRGGAVKAATAAAISPGDPHLATKAFLQEHTALFGFGADILTTAQIKREFVTPHNGMRTVVWEQSLDGITVFEGLLISHTTVNGELVNISSRFLPNLAQAADAGVPNRALLQYNPTVTAQQAVAIAAQNLGESVTATEVQEASAAGDDAEKRQRFKAAPLNGDAEARLIWLPMGPDRMLLCWEVTLTSRARGEMFKLLIDVKNGEVLVRHGLTAYISPASYNVFTSDSPSPFSPGHPTPLTNQPPLVPRTLVTLSALNTNASPLGWINDGANETLGNNVDAHSDTNNDNLPDLPRPQGSPFRVFDFPMDLTTQAPASYRPAAIVQLFYLCNWIHDKLYDLGFTEAAGNFQSNNFGRGGLGNDPVQADAQDGGGFNNANFSTPADGSSGRMQMYIFNGPNPDRDGDFDAEVVIHEYGHGLSNRRVGGGVGISALQSAGMGEGWSDFYGLTMLSEAGDDVNGNYAAGGYASQLIGAGYLQNYYSGIRRYPYSTDMTKNPLTFKDADPAQADYCTSGAPYNTGFFGACSTGNANEVHNLGEIWCMTLWEARANLINLRGWAVGNQLILQLVTDGMNLSPANPTFLQARDAILQAELVDTGGANRGALWAAFAKRGMGASATSPSSSSTTGIIESFDVPDDLAISPGTGFTANGPVSGPFIPAAKSFTLVNTGSGSINWGGAVTVPWLSLSQSNGVLTVGGTNAVNVSVNALANSLGAGIYNGTARFTNVNSGVTQSRSVNLRVGQPDYFTELFDTGDMDVDNQTLTFTPNGSSNYYAVCREPASTFPTDPSGGVNIALGAHTFQQLTLANNISIYGRSTNIIYLASEGHITLNAGDSSGTVSLANHFSRPRVTASLTHIHPTENGGVVSWLQLPDRAAITFNKVVEYGTTLTNSFQMELFYDGRIRMTHLAIGSTTGLVGLSAGNGVPSGFIESDLSSYGPCLLPMTVTIPHNATEGDGVLLGQGQVNVFAPVAVDTTVNLSSSDNSEATVPATVTILAGQSTADFDVTIVDDADLDGTQAATISASATGYFLATDNIQVADNESAILSVDAPEKLMEGIGTVTGNVRVNAAPAANVVVSLNSSDTTEIQVPPTVTLLSGQTTASFNITVVNDTQIDGEQTATVTASVQNWTAGSTNITVLDNEPTNLVVTLPASAREGNGLLSNAGSVRISGTLPTDLTVNLLSSDTTELTVPATATIFAGQTVGTFDLNVEDDSDIDGNQSVTVTATATGFSAGATNMVIYDDESPPAPSSPSPAHLATNVIQTADLAWQSGAVPGEIITNDVYFGTNPVPGPAQLLGTTTGTNWALPTLYPQTTYYWQIVARKTGITQGPVWQFTTRGLDHFTWNPVSSPQYVGYPFSTIISAKDAFETTVSNFTGTVNLSATGSGSTSNVMLGNVTHSSSSSGTYTLAFAVTPSANITVTHVRSYSGTKISIWTDAGVLVASQSVSGPATVWTETALASPVTLLAGTTYRVGYYTGGGTYYYNANRPTTFAHGTFVNGYYYTTSDAFPSTFYNADNNIFLCDLRYSTGSGGNFPFTPTVSGSFSNGLWTGNITALMPSTNVVLRADDGSGHVGNSAAFAVELQNDIGLSVVDSPDPVGLGGNVTYTITVTNIGPSSAADVTVTNILPATSTLVSVVPTQGTVTTNANVITCSLGTMLGNTNASVVIVAKANTAGTMTNRTTVSRTDTDSYSSNNAAVVTTLVQLPTITINDVSQFEGNAGTSTAAFTVTVSPAPGSPVSVNFATASGTALSPGDFVATNGVLNFAVGQTAATIPVNIIGDPLYELNETFTVNLSAATNATIGDSQGIGTILNDDPIPTLSITDVTLTEGNSGTNNAVFLVSLSAASGLDATVNYTTVNGNATSGSDYSAKGGFITIPAGSTNASIAVSVNGDLQIESDEVFYVDLSSPGNAILLKREGVGLIVNDDGLPGDVDHFVWNSIASTQFVGQPFGVTITALDAFNGLAVNFTNSANLTGLSTGGGALVTNTILGSPTPNNSSSGTFTLGYSFTPTNNLTVTHVRSYFGTKVSIWTDGGVLLASQNVSGGGTWTDTALTTPLSLTAGSTYRVAAYTGGGNYYWRTDGTNTFPNGIVNVGYEVSGDAFPNSSDGVRWWAVDLRYTTGAATGPHPIAPALTGPFVNGVWSGNITALAPTTNLVLQASDGNGHIGTSSSLVVALRDDIGVAVTDSPDPVAVGANLTYSMVVSNIGPTIATGVLVTNQLPSGITLLSVNPSQGTFTTNGQTVVCNLGTISDGGLATVTVLVTPTVNGVLTNITTISRSGPDTFAGNNAVTNTTTVVVPALSISDATGTEPLGGPTNMVFNVSLSVAGAQAITVNYATANGSAIAGSDYVATNGILNFVPGQTNLTVVVQLLDDATAEPNETLTVGLSAPVNATLAKATGIGTILDNDGPPEFQITALLTNNSKVVDHDALTGDDRGGVAISGTQVFITGDSATARFAAGDLTGGAGLGVVRDSLCTDLRTETVYLLGNGSTPLTSSGGTVTSLIELNGATGVPTGVVLPLSQSFTMTSSGNGIFSGYGRVVVHNGTTVYDIHVPTGTVTSRGSMTRPAWYNSESWSVWGVAEFFGGTLYLTYRDSSTQNIVRSRVPDGVVTVVSAFSNLSDMASFVVSPSRNRWYFHYEGSGQFGGTNETLGYADAQFSVVSTNPPAILTQPASLSAWSGSTAVFSVSASGASPLSYQWRKAATPLPNQTNATLTLLNVQTNDAGSYSVFITNLYGNVTSSNAILTVSEGGLKVSLFADSAYVDTGTSTSGEASNVMAAIVAAGAQVQAFSGIAPTAFSNALAGAQILYIPELEVGDLGAALSAAAKSVISNFVAGGGGLIINGESSSRDENFLNQVFGYSITTGSSSASSLLTGSASNTAFAGGPASIPENNGTYEWMRSSLPAGGLSIYQDSTALYTTVAVIPRGAGKIVFLAYDWYDAVPRGAQDGGWDQVLRRALLEARSPGATAAPAITNQPQSQTVLPGATVSFSVGASGTSPLQYQWRKQGVPLSGATAISYSITNAVLTNAGNYDVVVTNLYGAVTSAVAVLMVTNSPALKFRPVERQNTVLRLVVATADDSPISPSRASNVWVYASTNIALPLSSWSPLSIAPVLTNGVLVIDGVNPTNPPVRFFRAIEGAWNVQPLWLLSPQLSAGVVNLQLSTANGSALTTARAVKIRLYASTNLSLPFGNWQQLNVTPVLSNGVLQFNGLTQSNQPVRFFRALELP